MAIEEVEDGDGEGGIGEGGRFIAEAGDAGAVGGVGGIEISRCAGERVDGAGIDGTGGMTVEGVEY